MIDVLDPGRVVRQPHAVQPDVGRRDGRSEATTNAHPLVMFNHALAHASQSRPASIEVVDDAGRTVDRLEAGDWTGGLRAGDAGLLARCHGSTLDVGCGPGRLAAALARRGRASLGLDISSEAIRQARRRGARTWHGDVFAEVPMEGTWASVLLADGNIGIGGDPRRLLRRCAGLIRPRGVVLVELAAPGKNSWFGPVRLHLGEHRSRPFPWASVAVSDVAATAESGGFGVQALWTEAGRWFARLSR